MHVDDLYICCNILGIYPKKYDEKGWRKLLGDFAIMGVDVSDIAVESLVTSKKELDDKADAIKKEMKTPSTNNLLLVTMDADDYVKKSSAKQDELFDAFIKRIEEIDFPPYVVEIDPEVQAVIQRNFAYTYADDGKAIVYMRAVGEPGNVWDEVADSEHPFSKSKGVIRNELSKTLVARSKSLMTTVYVKNNGNTEFFEHVPLWQIHQKNYDNALTHVTGRPENVGVIAERLKDFINTLRRCHEGNLTHAELKHGMQEIPKTLAELDDSIDALTFFYYKGINLPSLTNDPKEAARAYFDLNTISDGPTPDFDGFMLSIVPECRDALMAAIYATFFAKSHLNQYVWIHGEGGDGKSSLLNAIAEYAGPHLACSLGQTMNSEFGLENAVGKRMVILSDVKTGLSVKSQLIHNLTGHDMISINRKNKPIISTHLDPIVWIAANEAPDVNFDNRNEARRCLYIKMQEPPMEVKRKFYFMKPDGTLEIGTNGKPINNGYDLQGHLVMEMPHILFKCRQAFDRCCFAPYSVIKPNNDAMQLAIENCVDIDAATFDTYIAETFDFTDKNAKLKQVCAFEAIEFTMSEHHDKTKINNFIKRDIRRLLSVKYNCKRQIIHGIHYLTGIKLKEGIYIYSNDDENETAEPVQFNGIIPPSKAGSMV